MMILLEAMVGAQVAMISEKKGEAYLAEVERRLSAHAQLVSVTPIRQTPRSAALRQSRIEAIEAWRASMPVLKASVRRG